MKNILKTFIIIIGFLLFLAYFANELSAQNVWNCNPPSAKINLDINNVSAGLLNGGDMWWDLVGSAAYEVPKGDVSSVGLEH